MDSVKDVAESVSLMSGYGYASNAVEYAAIYALNSSSIYRGGRRRRAVEDALADLVSAKAVFDVSGAYRVCLEALKAIDYASGVGVDLSVQDAIVLVMEMGNT